MLQNWKKNLNKTKIRTKIASLFLLAIAFLGLTASRPVPDINDEVKIIDSQTQALIIAKNNRYLQTKEQPQIKVITKKGLNNLTPHDLNKSKRVAYIVIGVKNHKKNVQVFSSKDLHSAFTAESRMNLIRSCQKELTSKSKQTFNRGVRFLFRACATKIDQRYQYALDKYDLSSSEQAKVDHPNRIALPIALAIVVIAGFLIYFLRSRQNLSR